MCGSDHQRHETIVIDRVHDPAIGLAYSIRRWRHVAELHHPVRAGATGERGDPIGASMSSQKGNLVVGAVSLWETRRVFQGLWEGGVSQLSTGRQAHSGPNRIGAGSGSGACVWTVLWPIFGLLKHTHGSASWEYYETTQSRSSRGVTILTFACSPTSRRSLSPLMMYRQPAAMAQAMNLSSSGSRATCPESLAGSTISA
jgi:hypothetical protein